MQNGPIFITLLYFFITSSLHQPDMCEDLLHHLSSVHMTTHLHGDGAGLAVLQFVHHSGEVLKYL